MLSTCQSMIYDKIMFHDITLVMLKINGFYTDLMK